VRPNNMYEAMKEGLAIGFGAPFTFMPYLQFNTTPLASLRVDLSSMPEQRPNLLDPTNLMTPLLPSKERLREAGYSDSQVAAISKLAEVQDGNVTRAYRLALAAGLVVAAESFATPEAPKGTAGVGKSSQLGKTVLRSEGGKTGVALLDRPAVQTPEYAAWK